MLFFILVCIALFIYVLALHNTLWAKNKEISTLSTKYQTLLDDVLSNCVNENKLLCEQGKHVWTKQTLPSYSVGSTSKRYFGPRHLGFHIFTERFQSNSEGVAFTLKRASDGSHYLDILRPTVERCQFCDQHNHATHSTLGLKEFCLTTYNNAQLLHRTPSDNDNNSSTKQSGC